MKIRTDKLIALLLEGGDWVQVRSKTFKLWADNGYGQMVSIINDDTGQRVHIALSAVRVWVEDTE